MKSGSSLAEAAASFFVVANNGLAAIAPAQLTANELGLAFSLNLAWQPELTGDHFRLSQKPLRLAAVMIALIESNSEQGQLDLLLTRRANTLREHSGQIAFPGGRIDESDIDDKAAALREAFEEIGLQPSNVRVLGRLPQYVTGSGFDISPVVGLVEGPYEPVLSEAEVSEVFRVPLTFLMNPANHRHHRMEIPATNSSPQGERVFYSMPYEKNAENYFIWGATAAMLRNFYRMLSAVNQIRNPLPLPLGEKLSALLR